MQIAATVKLTQDELNKYVLDGLKADGKQMPAEVELSVVISDAIAPAPVSTVAGAKTASTAPIGQTVEGFKVTHYGYPGDSSPDSESMSGIGDRGNKLIPNLSVALTKSARKSLFGTESPSTGKEFSLGVSRPFQDDDSAPEDDMRVDVYDPYYAGTDPGCTPETFAKSKAEMIAAGILLA
jgi:hypothetical protein